VPLSLSILADQLGAGCAVLEPILRHMEAHVFAAERLHGDDTTVPVLVGLILRGLRHKISNEINDKLKVIGGLLFFIVRASFRFALVAS
jgi:Transposase IS66 family